MIDHYVTRTGMVVDPALISTKGDYLFKPFMVERTEPLTRALERGKVSEDRELLVAELKNGVMVLDKAQMTYHHTAQGRHEGQAWMVTF